MSTTVTEEAVNSQQNLTIQLAYNESVHKEVSLISQVT